MISLAGVDRERILGEWRSKTNSRFLTGKSRRLLQKAHLLRYAANLIVQRVSMYDSRFGFCGASHLNLFEQPAKKEFFKPC